ncbi:hypothetical protein SLU01_33050 [Sporosarcina luteola]|uniref:Uncharacterized protein n=1 Tax=Sporosarcina luteola TaxID=582850 RepID=A0A511ZC46_9BACL|nr:hypothetical protein [Sporosarcina luteola]GEN84993.1 hypothetical protein SLU01_33050 [Sporosarcina luteola]
MSDRFELSFKNKVIKMWLVFMVPTVIVQILLLLFTEYPREILAGIPSIPTTLFFIWLYFHKRKQKKKENFA